MSLSNFVSLIHFKLLSNNHLIFNDNIDHTSIPATNFDANHYHQHDTSPTSITTVVIIMSTAHSTVDLPAIVAGESEGISPQQSELPNRCQWVQLLRHSE